jgi:hypothetical protein
MVSASYYVKESLIALPVGGAAAICLFDATLKTSVQFNLKTSGTIAVGTAYTFHLRAF